MKQLVLLTGASGLVGHETLKSLIDQNKYDIRVFDLKTPKSTLLFSKYKKQIEIFYGDITNKEDVKKAVKNVDFIIHLAAIIPPLADKNKELAKKVNIDGTKNLVEAAIKENKNIFFVYASSISVYGDRLKEYNIKVTDKLKPSPGDYYAETKIFCEKVVKESDLDYTIFRITGVMQNPKTDPLMFHMPLDTKFEIITSKDAGFAFANSINHKKELNKKTFNLAGGSSCRVVYKDFLYKNLKIFGLNFKYMPKEAFAKKDFHCGYLEDSDELQNILHHQRDTLDDYYNNLVFTTPKIKIFFSKLFNRPIIKSLLNKSIFWTRKIKK